jgi:hypothetical protein
MKTLSPADRVAACIVALVCVLMVSGVRYLFRQPPQTGMQTAPMAHPYMP